MCGCGEIINGVSGLAKVAANSLGANIDKADKELVQLRRDICRGCQFSTRNPDPKYFENKGMTSLSKCEKCGCFIAAKTTLVSEKCPEGKW